MPDAILFMKKWAAAIIIGIIVLYFTYVNLGVLFSESFWSSIGGHVFTILMVILGLLLVSMIFQK